MENFSDTKSLENRWTLWSHFPQDDDWSLASYRKICDFVDVEGTISVTEVLPENMIKNCMLFLMKSGISPIWEDARNRNGGCFSYKVTNHHVVDVWKDLTYALVGRTISSETGFINAVSGITISPKKNFCIIKIWMENCVNQNPLVVTGEIKNLNPNGCLFKKHVPTY